MSLFSCEGTNFFAKSGKPLAISDTNDNGDNADNADCLLLKDCNDFDNVSDTTHAIFSGNLGVPISRSAMGTIDPDPTGHTANNDYDGDGIPNNQEIITDKYIADYPKIVTRVSAPITMEIRKSSTNISLNHKENFEDTDMKETISNSMENKQYSQLNAKTIPVGKASNSTLSDHSTNYGKTIENKHGVNVSGSFKIPVLNLGFGAGYKYNNTTTTTKKVSDKLQNSSNTEKIIFEDVDYRDNLDRNGVEFKNDTIQNMARRFRQSTIGKEDVEVGPNAGFVRSNLYIKNLTVNIPVRVYDVKCTLSFRTPSGRYLPVRTFYLKNDDYTDFSEQIYGNEELGPFVIEVDKLNTEEVKNALAKGYTPQVHVVSYKIERIPGSNYHPGVDNLRLIEENVKGRTAQIKIVGPNMREIYRVAAFNENTNGDIIPGISLKKALFYILRDRIGDGEKWELDRYSKELTNADKNLRWIAGSKNTIEHPYSNTIINNEDDREGSFKGNTWRNFETFIKAYKVTKKNANGELESKIKYTESIKRINNLTKYNPYNENDNPEYDPNKDMNDEKLNQMGYWVILHNGKYFEGDLNDAIWVGERYEIIYVQVKDFNDHFIGHAYTPIQAETRITLDSRWNRLTNQGHLARSINIGKVIADDVIKLEIDIASSRFLFDQANSGKEMGDSLKINNQQSTQNTGYVWHDYNYTFDDGQTPINGIPTDFTYSVEAGTNSFKVKIDPGDKITEYSIRFWKNIDGEHHLSEGARWVHITKEQLEQRNNIVYINRSTFNERFKWTVGQPDKHPNQPDHVGHISNEEYSFSIYGYGRNNGVHSYKLSSSGSLKVTPQDPHPTDAFADIFDVHVNAYTNKISLDIASKDNAEGFLIRVYGPLNYGGTYETKDFKDYYGHDGNNIITIDTPTLSGNLKEDEKNLNVPGYYYVHVYAYNKNSLDVNGKIDINKCRMHRGEQRLFVNVPFEKYKEQKMFSPKKSLHNFDPRSVDLEVNFNDGSGWFRLKLSSNDKGANGKEIDCRKTTNIDYNDQKVTIYFKAPTGKTNSQNETYNVFRGGKNQVNVYLRIVPKPEFRDTIWPKQNSNSSFDMNATRGIYVKTDSINSLVNMDFLRYWITNPFTDATYIDEYISNNLIYNSYDEIERQTSYNGFGVKAESKNEFFFSPMVQRLYGVKSSIVNENIRSMMLENSHADTPSFRVTAGDRRIEVFDLDSQYADVFYVKIIKGDHLNDVVDVNNDDWQVVLPSDSSSLKFVANKYKFEVLENNKVYTIAVRGENSNSQNSTFSTWVKKTIRISSVYTQVFDEIINSNNGLGSFGYSPHRLYSQNKEALTDGVHFAYNEPLNGSLYNIYDNSSDISLIDGKYIKIISNGLNISDVNGLGLTPIAKDLSIITSPPSNECWIDPIKGIFVLPRPIYYSNMENPGQISNALIGSADVDVYPVNFVDGRFGLCGFIGNLEKPISNGIYNFYISSFKPQVNMDLSKGTASFWAKINIDEIHKDNFANAFSGFGGIKSKKTDYSSTLNAGSVDSWGVYLSHYLTYKSNNSGTTFYHHYKVILLFGSTIKESYEVSLNTFHHIYVVWDSDKNLKGGKSIRVFVNGIERLSSTDNLPLLTTPEFFLRAGSVNRGGAFSSASWIDNPKLWNHVVSENQTWIYNLSQGIDGALHYKYGPENGYSPHFNGETNGTKNGVGYYMSPVQD